MATGGEHPACQLKENRGFCWACSIPDLIWVKLALLDVTVSYNVNEDMVSLFQPVLAAASAQRAATYARVYHGQRWPPVPPLAEIKHRWRVKPHDMTPEKWHELVSEISDTLHDYHFGAFCL